MQLELIVTLAFGGGLQMASRYCDGRKVSGTSGCRYTWLAAGSHEIVFVAVAATSGAFVLPPVQASAVDQPEVSGYSAGGELSICADSFCAPRFADATEVGKACLDSCSDAGTCNTAKGTCICDPGFSGPSCATFSAEA